MAYVNKRSGKNGAERFTGLYKAADGTYKSAGTFDTEVRALEVAEAAERHARLQMAFDNGYRKDNPVRGIKLKGVPAKPIIVATKDQFLRVYNALPYQPAKVLARLGVSWQIHRGSDREVPSHRRPVSHEGVHHERRAWPVQGRSCGLGNGAGAHRALRNRARPGDLPGATVRLDRGRRPGPAHPRADRCPGLHR